MCYFETEDHSLKMHRDLQFSNLPFLFLSHVNAFLSLVLSQCSSRLVLSRLVSSSVSFLGILKMVQLVLSNARVVTNDPIR